MFKKMRAALASLDTQVRDEEEILLPQQNQQRRGDMVLLMMDERQTKREVPCEPTAIGVWEPTYRPERPLSVTESTNPHAYTLELVADRGTPENPWFHSVLLPPGRWPPPPSRMHRKSSPQALAWIATDSMYDFGVHHHGPCVRADLESMVRPAEGDLVYVPWTTSTRPACAFSYYLTHLCNFDGLDILIDDNTARLSRQDVEENVLQHIPSSHNYKVYCRPFGSAHSFSEEDERAVVTLSAASGIDENRAAWKGACRYYRERS